MPSTRLFHASRAKWIVVLFSALASFAWVGCRKSDRSAGDASVATPPGSSQLSVSSPASVSNEAGAPRTAMAWIPAGTFRAGTSPGRTPRVADEEMAGSPVEMGGFYIDLLPWPNEPNAIPTSNVTRDEAEQLCVTKGKRLCSELEWERACKGPGSTTYEYGDSYRKEVCGTGVALEQASRRPTGEHAQCKSPFGVAEMHGGVWEWTSSDWGRGSKDAAQGVLRGGNSVAGELASRCANAIARTPSKKAPTMGFRCCAGPKNVAEVKLELTGTPGLVLTGTASAAPWLTALASAVGASAIDTKSVHAWTWIPVANEELLVVTGCAHAPRACGLVVGRLVGADAGISGDEVLVSTTTGSSPPEIARSGDARHVRIRSLDPRGVFSRDLTYLYGRIDLGPPKRP